jgi:hypothetical protein
MLGPVLVVAGLLQIFAGVVLHLNRVFLTLCG